MYSFFFRKHIALLVMKKGGATSLMAVYIFSHGKTNSGCVAIGYVGSKSFVLTNQTVDKNGRLLLIEAIVDDVKFVLINCNTNKITIIIVILNHNNFLH